jgi:hypothetical protein
MKVQNMTNKNGNKVPNQFIMVDNENQARYFQSYDTVISKQQFCEIEDKIITFLDKNNWDYSKTTGKYRNQFLGETKKETEAKIKSGEYVLTDLNS